MWYVRLSNLLPITAPPNTSSPHYPCGVHNRNGLSFSFFFFFYHDLVKYYLCVKSLKTNSTAKPKTLLLSKGGEGFSLPPSFKMTLFRLWFWISQMLICCAFVGNHLGVSVSELWMIWGKFVSFRKSGCIKTLVCPIRRWRGDCG